MGDAAEMDGEDEEEYNRQRCDPSIGVADLEKSLETYFSTMTYRNLQEVLDLISSTANFSWKTSAKAMSLNFFSCFS